MKKSLTQTKKELYYYEKGVKKIYEDGNITGLSGDVTELSGTISSELSGTISSGLFSNVSGLSGDVTGLSGDVTGLYGDVTGLYGNVTGLFGNCDDCQITQEERKKGVNINDLII